MAKEKYATKEDCERSFYFSFLGACIIAFLLVLFACNYATNSTSLTTLAEQEGAEWVNLTWQCGTERVVAFNVTCKSYVFGMDYEDRIKRRIDRILGSKKERGYATNPFDCLMWFWKKGFYPVGVVENKFLVYYVPLGKPDKKVEVDG